ncbi:hypothetical protein Dsin_005259 [Dipteronia sinensis]|uniref:Uncharacterized protein n=1 Tax=Dipteronia sinensis TaxID=43782 RepID=A0AAE0EF13_9ROSI|nr:hypothetical protein Dsin_005259 [Dipteronia sinensis]
MVKAPKPMDEEKGDMVTDRMALAIDFVAANDDNLVIDERVGGPGPLPKHIATKFRDSLVSTVTLSILRGFTHGLFFVVFQWHSLADFREAVEDYDLEDMGYMGPKFTWSNKREGVCLIMKLLDRGLCTKAWKDEDGNKGSMKAALKNIESCGRLLDSWNIKKELAFDMIFTKKDLL